MNRNCKDVDASCFAAIDIGSNAVRLLIKRLEDAPQGPCFNKALLLRVPLRLGFDVFSNGCISAVKEKDLVRLMKAYRNLMKIYRVSDYRACATSAMRDASNSAAVIRKVKESTGIEIEVIDGRQEAMMIYYNHIEESSRRKGNYMYVDVGGGSTEISLISGGELVCSRSYDIGTVRMLNGTVSSSEYGRFESDMADFAASYPGISIIGSGGNINKLYRLTGGRERRCPGISVAVLKDIYEKLSSMTVQQRMLEYGLKPDRADVIVPAAEIFLMAASIIGAEDICVPLIGLADGIIDELYTKHYCPDRS